MVGRENTMSVKIRYFAWVRERVGKPEEVIDIPASVATVGQLMTWLAGRGEEYAHAFGNPKVIRAAIERGHKIDVLADETRPFLQGARLTAWELMKDNIPTTVLCDNMSAHLMSKGRIQAVIVGADRIAANGDTANKIGTYGVGILAKEHGIPFYVAAPFNTIDLATSHGDQIPIEQRSAREVTHSNGKQMTPDGVGIENPAFDVTPAKYITAIITERGVLRAPFGESIRAMAGQGAPA